LESICSNWLFSHLFVFAAWDTYTADRINKMFDLTNSIWHEKRRLGKLPSNAFKQLSQKDAEENFNHAAKQAYIAFSNYCCLSKVDTTLEGFDADALDEILGLRAKGLEVALCFLWVTETVKTTG
jgi:hypothetical protein